MFRYAISGIGISGKITAVWRDAGTGGKLWM